MSMLKRYGASAAFVMATLGAPNLGLMAAERAADCAGMGRVDPHQATTIEARIKDIKVQHDCAGGHTMQALVLVKAGEEDNAQAATTTVYLAPERYLFQKRMNFALGDDVSVKAVPVGGENTYAALEIDRYGHRLTLRNAQGRPVWGRATRKGAPVAH